MNPQCHLCHDANRRSKSRRHPDTEDATAVVNPYRRWHNRFRWNSYQHERSCPANTRAEQRGNPPVDDLEANYVRSTWGPTNPDRQLLLLSVPSAKENNDRSIIAKHVMFRPLKWCPLASNDTQKGPFHKFFHYYTWDSSNINFSSKMINIILACANL